MRPEIEDSRLTDFPALGFFHIWAPLHLLIGAGGFWLAERPLCWQQRLCVRLTFPSPPTPRYTEGDVKAFEVLCKNNETKKVAMVLLPWFGRKGVATPWDADVLPESLPGGGEGKGRETPGRDRDKTNDSGESEGGQQGGGGGGDQHQRLLLLEVDGQGKRKEVQAPFLALNLTGDQLDGSYIHRDGNCHNHNQQQPWSDHHSEVYSAHGAGAAEERRRDLRERRRHCTVRKVMMKRIWRGWWLFWRIMIHDVDWTIVAFFWKQECLPRLKFSLFVTVWPEQIFLWHLIRFLLFVLPSISFECCLNFDTKAGGTLFDQCSI